MQVVKLFDNTFGRFFRATRVHSADYAVTRCLSVYLSVCPSVTRQFSAAHILKVCTTSGSPTILVFRTKRDGKNGMVIF